MNRMNEIQTYVNDPNKHNNQSVIKCKTKQTNTHKLDYDK